MVLIRDICNLLLPRYYLGSFSIRFGKNDVIIHNGCHYFSSRQWLSPMISTLKYPLIQLAWPMANCPLLKWIVKWMIMFRLKVGQQGLPCSDKIELPSRVTRKIF